MLSDAKNKVTERMRRSFARKEGGGGGAAGLRKWYQVIRVRMIGSTSSSKGLKGPGLARVRGEGEAR